MSTPERPDLDTDARTGSDAQAHSVGAPHAASSSGGNVPWWKRLLGRG